jgi:predicted nucleotidyltransferase
MRLSDALRKKIVGALAKQFGSVDIILYGSRTDDSRRGGDYDIAINSQLDTAAFRRHKAQFFAQLVREGYELPIDLVQLSSAGKLLRSEIEENGIYLQHGTA